MKLVCGLGNPEGKYFSTYHNVGFVAAENVAQKLGLQFKKKGNMLLTPVAAAAGAVGSSKVIVMKPLTYMNLSGQAVVALCRKLKIAPVDVIVLCDDLYIEKGNIRLSFGGSAGGHNGLKSINELLGVTEYTKVRIGIKPTTEPHTMAGYVLSKIDEASGALIGKAIENAVEAVMGLVAGEPLARVQGKFNKKGTPE